MIEHNSGGLAAGSTMLVLNAGSSSLKFALYPLAIRSVPLLRGEIAQIDSSPQLRIRDGDAACLPLDVGAIGDRAAAVDAVIDALARVPTLELAAVGHRVVHGGLRFDRPVLVDAGVLAELRALVPLAPLHQPHNLAAIERIAERHPGLPQVACFDTAFHRRQPAIAQHYALPRALTAAGIIRYGFHGLSYEYVSRSLRRRVDAAARRRVVVAHLGSGASLCALRDGESIATTMGFSPLDGLPMATRCGSLDPAVVLHLISQRGMTVADVEHLLHHQSGLLGVSGISGDMRQLLADGSVHAQDAVDLYVYRINRELGSLVAALGGIDSLVFTGGIGEHAAEIRHRICELAQWTGLVLDADANRAGPPRISSADSAVSAWVVATDEEQIIARHARVLLRRSGRRWR